MRLKALRSAAWTSLHFIRGRNEFALSKEQKEDIIKGDYPVVEGVGAPWGKIRSGSLRIFDDAKLRAGLEKMRAKAKKGGIPEMSLLKNLDDAVQSLPQMAGDAMVVKFFEIASLPPGKERTYKFREWKDETTGRFFAAARNPEIDPDKIDLDRLCTKRRLKQTEKEFLEGRIVWAGDRAEYLQRRDDWRKLRLEEIIREKERMRRIPILNEVFADCRTRLNKFLEVVTIELFLRDREARTENELLAFAKLLDEIDEALYYDPKYDQFRENARYMEVSEPPEEINLIKWRPEIRTRPIVCREGGIH